MPQMTVDGMEDFLDELGRIGAKSAGIAKKCAYSGAAVMADAVRVWTKALPLDSNGHFVKGTDPLHVITDQDREDLAACVGVSGIESDGMTTTVSVSFDGYITRAEKKFPNGVPAAMIARSIESGSSVRAKRPFVRPAVRAASKEVLAAMRQTMGECIEQIQKLEE